jgi:hypothetical protein
LSEEFRKRLADLTGSGKPVSFEALILDAGTRVLEEGSFPQEYFDAILEALRDPAFLSLKDSWKMLRVFEYNWDELSESQRVALLPELEKAFACFDDWMACFVIAGMIGELYGDIRAFDALCRLKETRSETKRSLVPHGFEHIISGNSDPTLAKRALAELTAMKTDSSEDVRREVIESFSRLQKQAPQSPAE